MFKLATQYGGLQQMLGGPVRSPPRRTDKASWRCYYCDKVVAGHETYATHSCGTHNPCRHCGKICVYQKKLREHTNGCISEQEVKALLRRSKGSYRDV